MPKVKEKDKSFHFVVTNRSDLNLGGIGLENGQRTFRRSPPGMFLLARAGRREKLLPISERYRQPNTQLASVLGVMLQLRYWLWLRATSAPCPFCP
jgi:hypothetical protein